MAQTYVPPHKRPKTQSFTSVSRDKAASKYTFDDQTGQIYHEKEVIFRRKYNSDWIGEFKTPALVSKPVTSQNGSRPLLDIARSKCIREFRSFTPHHFETLPWSLASTIWSEIVTKHMESFHAWRTLASAYSHTDEFGTPDHRYYLAIRQPPLPIQDYFRGLTSSDRKWLTALRVSSKQTVISDLVSIAQITNLTVLDLSDGQVLVDPTPCHFDERIMRTWAELAVTGRAFQYLQALMLGWQDCVSDWIFKYLDCFPNLRHIITTDCRHMHQKNRTEWENSANVHGWTAHHAKKSVKLLRPILDDKQFHYAAISGLYYYGLDHPETLLSQTQSGIYERLPVVECWLGTPRSWTHIIDEFPGTRTIWFERSPSASTDEDLMSPSSEANSGSTKTMRNMDKISRTLPTTSQKRLQKSQRAIQKPPTRTAANLLADLGV